MSLAPLKEPSALIPVVMSFAALTLVLCHVAEFGVGHEADEGTAAHFWQLLMAGQVLVIAFYAFKWLPRTPKQALQIIGVQFVAAMAAIAPVYLLGL